jgi:hypothetical protein
MTLFDYFQVDSSILKYANFVTSATSILHPRRKAIERIFKPLDYRGEGVVRVHDLCSNAKVRHTLSSPLRLNSASVRTHLLNMYMHKPQHVYLFFVLHCASLVLPPHYENSYAVYRQQDTEDAAGIAS